MKFTIKIIFATCALDKIDQSMQAIAMGTRGLEIAHHDLLSPLPSHELTDTNILGIVKKQYSVDVDVIKKSEMGDFHDQPDKSKPVGKENVHTPSKDIDLVTDLKELLLTTKSRHNRLSGDLKALRSLHPDPDTRPRPPLETKEEQNKMQAFVEDATGALRLGSKAIWLLADEQLESSEREMMKSRLAQRGVNLVYADWLNSGYYVALAESSASYREELTKLLKVMSNSHITDQLDSRILERSEADAAENSLKIALEEAQMAQTIAPRKSLHTADHSSSRMERSFKGKSQSEQLYSESPEIIQDIMKPGSITEGKSISLDEIRASPESFFRVLDRLEDFANTVKSFHERLEASQVISKTFLKPEPNPEAVDEVVKHLAIAFNKHRAAAQYLFRNDQNKAQGELNKAHYHLLEANSLYLERLNSRYADRVILDKQRYREGYHALENIMNDLHALDYLSWSDDSKNTVRKSKTIFEELLRWNQDRDQLGVELDNGKTEVMVESSKPESTKMTEDRDEQKKILEFSQEQSRKLVTKEIQEFDLVLDTASYLKKKEFNKAFQTIRQVRQAQEEIKRILLGVPKTSDFEKSDILLSKLQKKTQQVNELFEELKEKGLSITPKPFVAVRRLLQELSVFHTTSEDFNSLLRKAENSPSGRKEFIESLPELFKFSLRQMPHPMSFQHIIQDVVEQATRKLSSMNSLPKEPTEWNTVEVTKLLQEASRDQEKLDQIRAHLVLGGISDVWFSSQPRYKQEKALFESRLSLFRSYIRNTPKKA